MPEQAAPSFSFVDESGDPGFGAGSNPIYILACMHVDQATLGDLIKHVSAFRYHHGVIKELKDWGSLLKDEPNTQMKAFWGWITAAASDGRLTTMVNWLDKATYVARGGPHLGDGSETIRFRNFQLRLLLQRHRLRQWSNNIDLVVDRWSMNQGQEDNLRTYLRENAYLQPPLAHITISDSAYVEALQVVDLFTRIARKVIEGEGSDWHQDIWNRAMVAREVTGGIYSYGGPYWKA